MTDRPDEDEPDGRTARRIVQLMLQNQGRQWFLGAGFHKPHLPWVAPKKYFDLYDPAKIPLPDTPADDLSDVPPIALTHVEAEKSMPDSQRKECIRAYHACTSFTDAQIGVLLNALDRLKLRDNTVVLMFGDHGWHLNEHLGLWRKMTVFEEAAHAPLIVSAPGRKRGAPCPRLVEFVDIYPTLAELCGLSKPTGVEGTSFALLLDNPQRNWKKAAYTVVQHRRVIGRSVRTDRYRYTEWDSPEVAELYDHETDPKEFRNLAFGDRRKDAKNSKLIQEMQGLLRDPKLALPGA
jgi:uncharacterized sulfatase